MAINRGSLWEMDKGEEGDVNMRDHKQMRQCISKWSNKLNFKHKIPLVLQKEINSIWMKYIRKLSLSIKYTYVYNNNTA